jgi:hypothetical protein
MYDKELMAIIKALEQWRPECESAAHSLQLITDHKILEYFMMKKLLNCRQARWSEFLTHFDYQIVYRPGKSNYTADALTTRPGVISGWGNETLKNTEHVVLKRQNLPEQLCLLANGPSVQGCPFMSNIFTRAYEVDPFPEKKLKTIWGNDSLKEITMVEYTKQGGQVLYRGRHYIPEEGPLRLVLATVADCHFGSGSESERNH